MIEARAANACITIATPRLVACRRAGRSPLSQTPKRQQCGALRDAVSELAHVVHQEVGEQNGRPVGQRGYRMITGLHCSSVANRAIDRVEDLAAMVD